MILASHCFVVFSQYTKEFGISPAFICMTCVTSNSFTAPWKSFSYVRVSSFLGYHKVLVFLFCKIKKLGMMIILLMMNICFTNIKFKHTVLHHCSAYTITFVFKPNALYNFSANNLNGKLIPHV